jgi:hypothetical protein
MYNYSEAVVFLSGPLRPSRLCGEVTGCEFTLMMRLALRSNLYGSKRVASQSFTAKTQSAMDR